MRPCPLRHHGSCLCIKRCLSQMPAKTTHRLHYPMNTVLATCTPVVLQVAAVLNNADLAKLAFTHNLDRTASVGAEVSKKITDSAESPTKFTVGYAKRLQGGGLAKARLDNAGASLLHNCLPFPSLPNCFTLWQPHSATYAHKRQ